MKTLIYDIGILFELHAVLKLYAKDLFKKPGSSI